MTLQNKVIMKHKIAERPKCRVCGRSMVKTRMGAFICYICGEWLCPADFN